MLADDLAGAHDVAVPFAKRGFDVAVPTGLDRLDRLDEADLVVLNTNSRSCGEAEATARIGAACEAIRARSGALIYKKIDSTLRGHVGLEIDLVSDMLDFGLVVCAPAFPEMGRTTVGGYQLLHGVPVHGRDMACPDIPPKKAFIPELLDKGSGRASTRIDLKTVHGGSATIREAFARIQAASGTTVVVDMADPTGWDGLLEVVLEDREAFEEKRSSAPAADSLLLCGSGGMAGALAERLVRTSNPRTSSSGTRRLSYGTLQPSSRSLQPSSSKPRVTAPSPLRKEGPILVFACSLHDMTARQVEEVKGRLSTAICSFDPLSIVNEQKRVGEVERLTTCVVEAMANGRNAIVTPKRPDRSELKTWLKRLSEKAGDRDPASVVIEHLGRVARRLFAAVDPGGIVLTGGETAGSVFKELDSDGAWILDEIEPGVACAVVAGGPRNGMGVVIKPGSFGDEHTLAKAVARLSPRAVNTKAGDTMGEDTEAGDAEAGDTMGGKVEDENVEIGDTMAGDTPVGTTGPASKRATGNL